MTVPFTPNPNGLYARIKDIMSRLKANETDVLKLSTDEASTSTIGNRISSTLCEARKRKAFRNHDWHVTLVLDDPDGPVARIWCCPKGANARERHS